MKSSHPTGLFYNKRQPNPKKEDHGDCGTRAICLAFDLPYSKVWNAVTKAIRGREGFTRIRRGPGLCEYRESQATANGGTSRRALSDALGHLGIYSWEYTKCIEGTKFLKGNFPDHCIAYIPNHYVAIKDGSIWDTWDSRGKRTKKLLGYFSKTVPTIVTDL